MTTKAEWSARPGRNWRDKTWRRDGYELEYRRRAPGDTPDTGWYLYGPNGSPFGKWMERTIAGAQAEADKYIHEHQG